MDSVHLRSRTSIVSSSFAFLKILSAYSDAAVGSASMSKNIVMAIPADIVSDFIVYYLLMADFYFV